jgi:hypothetical protein
MSDSGRAAAWLILGAVISMPFVGPAPLVAALIGVYLGMAFIKRYLR